MCGGDSKKEDTKKDAATIRKETIEKGFSAWDGSHTKLVELTKAQMNDPKSFDHLQTNYWDRDSIIVVKMQNTGKNALGGIVRGYVMAHCSIEGDVLRIVESQ